MTRPGVPPTILTSAFVIGRESARRVIPRSHGQIISVDGSMPAVL